MEPVTAAIVGSQALGAMTSFKGAKNAARATQAVSEYNAQVTENNAILLARAKKDEEANLRRQGEALKSAQTVATAASGVELKGSPMLALADTYFGIEQDVARLQYAGDIEQIGAESTANLQRIQGQAQSSATLAAGYGSLLGDVASTYSTYKAIG